MKMTKKAVIFNNVAQKVFQKESFLKEFLILKARYNYMAKSVNRVVMGSSLKILCEKTHCHD
jgi:hypothetical protein